MWILFKVDSKQRRRSSVFFVNFEQIWLIVLLLIVSIVDPKQLHAGWDLPGKITPFRLFKVINKKL